MRSRRRPTTTATSRSRTCRRCASTRPGWPRCGPRCRSCRRRAGRATGDARAVAVRRRGAGRRPGRDGPVRGDAAPPTPALGRRSRRELGHRGVPAPAQRRPGAPVEVAAAELAAIIRGGRGRCDLARERQGGVRGARGDAARPRPPSSRRAACARSRDGGAVGAAVDEVARRQPGRRRRLPGRQGQASASWSARS